MEKKNGLHFARPAKERQKERNRFVVRIVEKRKKKNYSLGANADECG